MVKMDELQALSYFSTVSHISRKVALQEKSLIKHLGNKWADYSPEYQEEILDDLCVPHSYRDEQFGVADDDFKFPSCWPTLKLPSGEKIIVDENDIWTWRDEHSGPFSWKSKSQQDLTLLDLEPEGLTKPHKSNQKSIDSDEPSSPVIPASRRFFLPNLESWTQAVLDDFKINFREEVQTPVQSPTNPLSPAESPPEEVNPAYEGSVEDLSPTSAPAEGENTKPEDRKSVEVQSTDEESLAEVHASKGKTKGLKAPSPKRLPHPGLLIKDGKISKSGIDTSQQLLITGNGDEERNVFTNPAMEVEWSNFLGQSSTDPDDDNDASTSGQDVSQQRSSSSDTMSTMVMEPPPMVMDRGSFGGTDDSVESTPDHTTQLLKGATKETAQVVEEAEKEEVVYVVGDGAGSVSVSSRLVATPTEDSDLPRSGFDFLDNW